MGFDTFEEHHVNWSAKKHTSVIRKERGTPGTGQRRCQGKNKVQGPDVMPQCGSGENTWVYGCFLDIKSGSASGAPPKNTKYLVFWTWNASPISIWGWFYFCQISGHFDVRIVFGDPKKIRVAMGPFMGPKLSSPVLSSSRRMWISSSQAGKLRSTSRAEIHIVPAANSPSVTLWLFDDTLLWCRWPFWK